VEEAPQCKGSVKSEAKDAIIQEMGKKKQRLGGELSHNGEGTGGKKE